MNKLFLAVVFFLFCLALAGASFFLGQRLTTQKYVKIKSLLSVEPLEAFCTNFNCKALGLKGKIAGYDYRTKVVDFLTTGDTHFNVPLTNLVKIDDSSSILYFEKNWEKEDVIFVIFNMVASSGSKLDATDIYFDKTGILAKKKLAR